MLRRLSVENYALIDKLEMELDPHLNIITGETGAGKAILLGARGMLLGAKNDGSAMKDAARNCTVEGIFDLTGSNLETFFDENDLDYAPETTLTRMITPAGKSRAFINDIPVQLAQLNKLLNIEVRTMKRLVRRDYLPAINTFAADVARHISEVRAVMPDADLSFQERKLRRCVEGAAEINNHLERLNDLHHEAQAIADEQERANKYAHEVIPVMDDLRQAVDSLEILVESKYWPVPSYNNILFYA